MADLSPTTAGEIITAFNTTVADGDRILLPTGTFDCSATPLVTTKYFDVVGPGSGLCTILCNVSQQPATSGQGVNWSGVTLDCSSSNQVADGFGVSAFYYNKAQYVFQDVIFEGPCLDAVALVNIRAHLTFPVTALFLSCGFDKSQTDLLISKGDVNADVNRSSWVRCHNCYAIDRGAGASDQAYSAHDGVRMDLYDCTYANSNGSIDNRSCIAPGASVAGGLTMMRLNNCDIVGKVAVAQMLGGSIQCTNGSALKAALETGAGHFLFAGVEITQTSGTTRGIETEDESGRIESCLVTTGSGNNGVYVIGSGDVEIVNSRFVGMATCVGTAGTATGTITARNNICEGATRANFQHASATTVWNWDYNRISGVDNHVVGTHDFSDAADIDANGVPTVDGNCYLGEGDQALPYFYFYDILENIRESDPTARALGPIEPASAITTTAAYSVVRDLALAPLAGVVVKYRMIAVPDGSLGAIFDRNFATVTSDPTGTVNMPLVLGATYEFYVDGHKGLEYLVPLTAGATHQLPAFVVDQ